MDLLDSHNCFRPAPIIIGGGSVINRPWGYIALQGTTKEALPQVKLGKTLNLRLLVCVFDTKKVYPESWCNKLSIKQPSKKKIPKDNFT